MQQNGEPCSMKRMSKYIFLLIKNGNYGEDIPDAKTMIHASQRYTKLYTLKHVCLVEIQVSEQPVEKMHKVSNLSQNPGNACEKIQKSGGKLVYVVCYFVIHWAIRTGKLNEVCANNFLILMCSSLELEMASAKIGNLDWTFK